MKLTGIVTSGVGEGAKFLALTWVARELQEKLSLTPFPGTLNLRVAPGARAALFARRHEFIKITDPSSPDCPGYVTRVTVRTNGRFAESYLILPEKSQYADVLEILSAVNLRQHLALKDGDVVEIEIA
jgi:riboflavin kinase, archaea type